ncbi:DnaT-like ssDNA-binding domain-containing protein [Enterobacter cloacae]|uniref:DnaT-like ssDNA-binding domain-containing protein n=1 Tax=Enterobacter cloacae TaxID=550 RepID=UPI003352B05E
MPNTKPKTKANTEPYRKVKITMWDDPKFRSLSPLPPSGQSLFIYLLTGPFTGIIPGLFKAGRAAMAEELGWNEEAFDLALTEAITLGLVKFDKKARVFWLPNAAKHNPPGSINVVKSWGRAFELLPDCDLKKEAWESLKSACYGVSEAMGKAFDMAIPLPKPMASPLPSGIQKAVSSKQIIKPEREFIARDKPVDNFPDNQPPDVPPNKFRMHPDWKPLPGFCERASDWGHSLPPAPGFSAAQLRQFKDYWRDELTSRTHTQWEMAFAESLSHQKPKKIPKSRDVNHIPEPSNKIPKGFRGYEPDDAET